MRVGVAALFGAMVWVQGCGPSSGGMDAGPSDGGVEAGDARDAGEASTDADESVVAVQITPATATSQVYGTSTFTATARLRSGRTRDVSRDVTWASSDANVATIDATGVATAQRVGTTTITATLGAIVSNAATLTVACEGIQTIAFEPSTLDLTAGDAEPHLITARITSCDGTTAVINSEMGIMWTTSNTTVATVDAMGRVTAGTVPGTALITARLGTVSGTVVVSVRAPEPRVLSYALDPPRAVLPLGAAQRFSVVATDAAGTTRDVTSMATFTLEGAGASLGMGADTSLVTARAPGAVVLVATIGGTRTTASVTVLAAPVASVFVEPAVSTLTVGSMQALHSMGRLASGAVLELVDDVRWTSSAPTVAAVDDLGRATGVAASSAPATITASYLPPGGGATLTSTASVRVVDSAVRSISARLDPAGPIRVGGAAQLRVQATYADGSSRDITDSPGLGFSSGAVATATVSGARLVRGIADGATTVEVQYRDLRARVPVRVVSRTATGVTLTVTSPAMAVGEALPIRALLQWSDGSTSDATDDAGITFASSAPGVLAVSNAALSRGLATAHTTGAAMVTATYAPLVGGGTSPLTSAPAALTVTDARITALEIAAGPRTIAQGFSMPFTVTGRYSDGRTRDVTRDPNLAWSSSSPAVAAVATRYPRPGLVQAIAPGAVVLTATYVAPRADATAVSATAMLTVTAATLTAIAVSPSDARVAPNAQQRFVARGTFSDGTSADVTDDVQWSLAPEFAGGSLWDLSPDRGLFTAGPAPVARTMNAVRASRLVGATRVEGSSSLAVEASP